jgi:hypothetical protein
MYKNEKKVIVALNLNKWDEVQKSSIKIMCRKGIKKEHILLLLFLLALNNDHNFINNIISKTTERERKII